MTQSVELLLDDEQDAAMRGQWAALEAAGLPSQGRIAEPTNRPHITLCVAAAVPAYLETALKAALTGRLPIAVRLGGLLCFAGSGDRQILTRAVVPGIELLELQATCADLFANLTGVSPQLQPGAWSPHVTLAYNLPTDRMADAIKALGRVEETDATGVEIRRWNSETRTAWPVSQARTSRGVRSDNLSD